MENIEKNGWLYINKPLGFSSFAVIAKLRRITRIRKIGHSGTLDPLATGLLIVAVGRAYTKQLDKYLKQDKTYRAILKLGYKTETLDAEKPEEFVSNYKPTLEEIEKVLKEFTGEIQQTPPIYSAIQIDGKRLYKLAREGKGDTVEIPSRPVTIYKIKLLEYNYPNLEIEVEVSSGTYIRSLVRDIGESLKAGAYLTGLIRTEIADLKLEEAVDLKDLNEGNWEKYLKK